MGSTGLRESTVAEIRKKLINLWYNILHMSHRHLKPYSMGNLNLGYGHTKLNVFLELLDPQL